MYTFNLFFIDLCAQIINFLFFFISLHYLNKQGKEMQNVQEYLLIFLNLSKKKTKRICISPQHQSSAAYRRVEIDL